VTRSFFAAVVGFIAIVLGNAPSFAQNAYIPNGNTVSVIHTPTNTIGAAIPVGATTTGAIAVSTNGRKVYVGAATAMPVIDTLANAVVATNPINGSPLAIAIGPYGRRLHVATDTAVSVIQTETNIVIGTIPIVATSLVVTPDGNKVYITQAPNMVSVIDTETDTVIDTITLAICYPPAPITAGCVVGISSGIRSARTGVRSTSAIFGTVRIVVFWPAAVWQRSTHRHSIYTEVV
jgi:YVTN family beta-propeller protein